MEKFNYPPLVEVLEKLTKGSLKQDLPKALRLWVILRSLYGESYDPVKTELDEKFSLQQWQNQFFNDKKFHLRDSKPQNHDPNCNCAKTISEWLFEEDFGSRESVWKESFKTLYNPSELELTNILTLGRPNPQKNSLPEGRLFAVTGKNLETDFNALVKMGFLLKKNKQFSLVTKLPTLTLRQRETPEIELANLAPYNLGLLLEKFNQKIKGETRFFVEIDDIIPIGDRLEELQNQLVEIWQEKPVPPILLNYRSAKLFQEELNLIVYPVCLYYYRRAPYLIAYGQFPGDETRINWYDYRIDHIISLKKLNWDDVDIPKLRAKCSGKKPPNLERVRELMGEALGFDFYEEAMEMFLWFNPYFYGNYIEGTERASIFKEIEAPLLKKIINKEATLTKPQRQYLLSRIEERPKDKYYRIKYRKNDNHVVMRLRAWGPNVEVILPYELRQRMTLDLANTWKLYN